ncbi:MAG: hypothetical protein DDT23_01295 [candidate division WS2 bacterium]|nr:hypothetical protein [Candidatus Lithacetigena glycinireducens]
MKEKVIDLTKTRKTQKKQLPIEEKTKEAWEMTRDEFIESRLKTKFFADQIEQKIRTKEQMIEASGLRHRREVRAAIDSGRTVPPEVLKDYPDLQALVKPKVPKTKPLEVIIDKAAGGEVGWIATYKSDDWGTERLVTVKDAKGNIIGQRDPFYPAGVPVDKKQRDRRIRKVIKDIVLDYYQR